MAAPVIRDPSERIFGDGSILSASDPNRDALVVIGQFRTGEVPAPYLQPLTDLPGRFLARLIGAVAAYNLVVLVTFPLAAAAAYLLGRHVLGSHLGALAAALVYAFLPFHVMQAGGHPHAAQTQWIPLYVLALWRFVDRPGAGRAMFVLGAAAAAGLADFYSGFIIAVLTPVAAVVYALSPNSLHIHTRWKKLALTLAAFIVVITIGYIAVRSALPIVISDPGSIAMKRSDLFVWSAKWWSYLIPPADHPLVGTRVLEFWNARGQGVDRLEHQQLSLGLSLMALALIPLWRFGRGERDDVAVRLAPALALLAGTALVCSLSPERTIGSISFVRPSALLYEWAPMFRAYARFGVIVGLMTALLAGGGVAWLWSRGGTKRLAAALLLGVAALEYAPFPPWRSRDILPTSAHRRLVGHPGPARILDCAAPGRFSDTLAAAHLSHPLSWLGTAGIDDCGEPRLGEKLKALGFTHVIARRDTVIAIDPALSLEETFEDSRLLRVTADVPRAHIARWMGFHAREHAALKTWRWVARAGTLRYSIDGALDDAILRIELRSFPGARRVDWSLDGVKRGELDVTPEWRPYELTAGRLEKGVRDFTLTCRESAVAAEAAPGNGDPRELCLAVASWQLTSREP
jgi:hypothetical protein